MYSEFGTRRILRVRYSETDKMGIVYYANYLVWFEIGRAEYCRARGFSYREMEENDDAFLVVAESYCRYKAPAYYDDELIVRTHITELSRRSLRFGYEIVRASDGQVVAEGETGHVVTDSERSRTLISRRICTKIVGATAYQTASIRRDSSCQDRTRIDLEFLSQLNTPRCFSHMSNSIQLFVTFN